MPIPKIPGFELRLAIQLGFGLGLGNVNNSKFSRLDMNHIGEDCWSGYFTPPGTLSVITEIEGNGELYNSLELFCNIYWNYKQAQVNGSEQKMTYPFSLFKERGIKA